MTNDALIAPAVWFFASLAMLWVAYFYVYRPAMTTYFRHEIMNQRRKLFLLVAEGKLSPDNEAYRRVRSSANGLAHAAEHVSLSSFVYVMFRPAQPSFDRPWEDVLAEVPEGARDTVRECRDELGWQVTRFIMARHPFISVVGLAALLVFTMIRFGFGAMTQAAHKAKRRGARFAEAPPFVSSASSCP